MDHRGEIYNLRYGENLDQSAALYGLTSGRLTLDNVIFHGPGQKNS
ncbi:hypothetical protein DSUL_100032 [Desulfovibrionales bacterium]